MGYDTFSEYVQALLERDTSVRPAHVVVYEEDAGKTHSSKVAERPPADSGED